MKKFTTVLMAIVLAAVYQSTAWGSDYSDYVTGRGDLIAYYKFDETSGGTADNAEGTASYDGTINGATLGANGPRTADGFSGLGTANDAFLFNGGTDNVVMPTGVGDNVDPTTTVSFFIKHRDLDFSRVVDFSDSLDVTNRLSVIINGSQIGIQSIQNGTYGNYNFECGLFDINDENWHHVIAVRSGTNTVSSDLALYVDGSLVPYSSYGGGGAKTGTAKIGNAASNDQGVNGGIDEVAIFNTAFSAADAKALYRAARPEPTTNYTYSAAVMARSDLIAFYQFEELSGTTVDNSQGNAAYDGTASWTLPTASIAGPQQNDGFSGTGPRNKAFDFDGASRNIKLPAAAQTAMDDDSISVAFFFRDDAPGTWQRMFDLGLGSGANELAFGTQEFNGRAVNVQSDQGSGYKGYIFTTGNAFDDNRWHHVVVTRANVTGGSGAIAVYVDGVALPYQEIGGVSPTTGSVTIGSRPNDSQWVNGSIDDVAIFSTALSPNDVEELYRAARPLRSYSYADTVMANTNLIEYFQFEDDWGAIIASTKTDPSARFFGRSDIPLPDDSVAGPRPSDGFGGMGTANKAFDFGASTKTEIRLTDEVEAAIDRSNLTFTAFVKLDGGSSRILDTATSGVTYPMTIQNWNISGQKLVVMTEDKSGNGIYFGNGEHIDGEWHHLVVVRDGTDAATDVDVYVDGVQLAITATGSGSLFDGTLTIGAKSNQADQYVNGCIDDVAFFSYAMTAEEVEALYLAADPVLGTVIVIR